VGLGVSPHPTPIPPFKLVVTPYNGEQLLFIPQYNLLPELLGFLAAFQREIHYPDLSIIVGLLPNLNRLIITTESYISNP
jgi:hypothetical protein